MDLGAASGRIIFSWRKKLNSTTGKISFPRLLQPRAISECLSHQRDPANRVAADKLLPKVLETALTFSSLPERLLTVYGGVAGGPGVP